MGLSNVPWLALTIAPRPILVVKAVSVGEHGHPFLSFASKLWSHSRIALQTTHGEKSVSIFHHVVLEAWGTCGEVVGCTRGTDATVTGL